MYRNISPKEQLFLLKKAIVILYNKQALHTFLFNLSMKVGKVERRSRERGCLTEYYDFCENPSDLNKLFAFLEKYFWGISQKYYGGKCKASAYACTNLIDYALEWDNTTEDVYYWHMLNNDVRRLLSKYVELLTLVDFSQTQHQS